MKILILGASGLTGYKSATLAKEKDFEVYGTYNVRIIPMDITNIGKFFKTNLNEEGRLAKLFEEVRPDILLNCTALHNVDYCETHPEEAFFVNADLVNQMASLCNSSGARFIHISTDYVFDGEKRGAYVEHDKPNPISVYARSKLEGESKARRANSHSIVRPSVVYGWTPLEIRGSTSSSGKPMNFGLWALNKLKNGDELSVVNDQFTSPTLADTLASAMLKLALSSKNEIYHVAGNSCTSRYEFTRKIAEIMGYPNATIKPIISGELGQAARRPLNSCLNCDKVQRELSINLPTVEESLLLMRSHVRSESPSLLGSGQSF